MSTETKWVAVTDRLPIANKRGESERLLVVAKAIAGRPESAMVMIGWMHFGDWIIEDDLIWESDCVTHWMPLPELPKGEKP